MNLANITGNVERFKGNGRKLGYPTANIRTATGLGDGVYFGHADLGEWQNNPAIIFIGTPTTLGDTERRVEAYLLDIPDRDYYGQPLHIPVEHFHRSNETFKGIDELLEVMRADETAARAWCSSGNGRL